MEIVLHIEADKFAKVKDLLLKDEIVNRASIMFKGAEEFELGKKGYYCYISGVEEQCKRALEVIKEKPESGEEIEMAKVLEGEEKEKIINKIKEEEDKAIKGFGGIFG